MGFSSIQAYLDPSNWQHQQNHPVIRSTTSNPNNSPPPPPHGAGSIRPGSMSERARLANIPMPDAAQKCPRCDSTNTKFCYFNNYSLSQPRHFCKTCRRYWTRGGVLRNVPVGGGYRRNKRSKSSTNSKPPASGNIMSLSGGSISTSISGSTGDGSNTTTAANILGLTPQLPPLRFESPLSQQLSHHGFATDVGLNHYSGISTSSSPILSTSDQNIGLLGHGGMPSLLSSSGIEPWRLHQYPFLSAGLEPHSAHAGIFNQFQVAGQDHHQGNTAGNGFVCDETGSTGAVFPHIRPKATLSSSSSMMSPLGRSIKMEDNLNSHAETNLSRQFLGGVSIGNDDAAWIHELPSFSSSSTSKLPL